MSLAASSFDIHIGQYEQLSTRYEVEAQCLWYAMHAEPRPCFNPTLLSEIAAFQQEVGELVRRKQLPISYLVLCSNVPGVFNLGGDLNLFQHHIEQRDRAGLALGQAQGHGVQARLSLLAYVGLIADAVKQSPQQAVVLVADFAHAAHDARERHADPHQRTRWRI